LVNDNVGTVTFEAPTSWKPVESNHVEPGTASYRLFPPEPAQFELDITFIDFARAKRKALTDKDLETYVESDMASAAPQSIEGKATAVRFGPRRDGVYVRLTDKAPKPGEFTLFTQGVRLQGDRLVLFTLMSNDKDASVLKQALAVVESVRFAPADVVGGSNELRLSLANGSKAMVMPKDDWTIAQEKRRPDGEGVYYMMTSDRRQISLSVFVERSAKCNSSASCLALALENPQYREALGMRRSDEGPFRVAQFHLDRPRGMPVQQANVLASAYVEGTWFDVHISKAGADRPDMAVLMQVLREVAIR